MKYWIGLLFLLIAFPAFADTMTLTWQDNSGLDPKVNNQEEGFNVYRSINGVPESVVGTVGPNVVKFIETIAQTSINQLVCYSVTAFNHGAVVPPATVGPLQESGHSNQACKTVPMIPFVIPANPSNAVVQ